MATLDQIELKDRTVYLAFDSDYQRNAQVRSAKRRLAAVLRQRGAIVYDILLPESTPGIKVGLDDYLANGGSRIDLFRLEMVELTEDADEPSHEDATGPYISTPSGIVYRKPTQNGPVDQQLSNFTARITEEVIADDGASERAELVIEGALGGERASARSACRRGALARSIGWTEEWGARYPSSLPAWAAGIGCGKGSSCCRRTSRAGASSSIPAGARLPDGWAYLHAGGAIGPIGPIDGIDVALRGTATNILFPDAGSDEQLHEAIRLCLSLLDLAPDAITVPLFGSVYRAPLCHLVPADVSLFLVGPTGVFKSELAAIAMQHYGAGFDRLHLPAHWSATANFLERAAFDFKDAPLIIDDFAPSGTQIEVSRLHATADRAFRGAGNRGGRGRMNADGSLRTDYPPRGVLIGTGEDAPRGQSLRSRMMMLDVAPGDVSRERLTTAQDVARRGVFAGLMGRFIQHLAGQFDALAVSLPAELARHRERAYQDAAHARTPDAVAHLAVGWSSFLRFAAAVGAVTETEAQATFARVWAALGDAAAQQMSHQASEEPAKRFIDLLRSALAGGFAHVADPNGETPHPFAPWGWRHVLVGAGEYERHDWKESGTRVGWVDGDDLYLDLEAALTATQRVGQATGSGVAIGAKTLAKRLQQRGFVRSTDTERQRVQVRKTLQGSRRTVLHLAASTITPQESAQSSHSAHGEQESTAQSQSSSGNGPISWDDFPDAEQESAHKTGPLSAPPRGDGTIGTIGTEIPA